MHQILYPAAKGKMNSIQLVKTKIILYLLVYMQSTHFLLKK